MRGNMVMALPASVLCWVATYGLAGDPAAQAPQVSTQTTVFPPTGMIVKDIQVLVGERIWCNWANSTWNFAGPSFIHPYVNPADELKWKGVYATVSETNFDLCLNRLVARIDIGWGGISGGHVYDAYYNGDNRTDLYSLSRTQVTGDGVFYLTADIGYRLLSLGGDNGPCRPALSVDGLMGYQYAREKYVAANLDKLFSVPPYSTIPAGTVIPGTVGTEVWERNNIRVGFRGNYNLSADANVYSRLMFVPWGERTMTDNHLLHSRVYKNKGDGGFGIFWDASISYRMWHGLSAEVGYQIWFEELGHGTTGVTAFGIPVGVLPLKDLETFRHGVFAGFNWRF